MSSATLNSSRVNFFDAYLIIENEEKETETVEKPEEKPTEPNASWTHAPYAPKRVNYHTIQGKIKRLFA